ncbi:Oidioi.mRNA.OKI2018_I69.XSR.g13618.t1.cds [Oikopleura dioica]|uniref:Oidioi.mRNA.OKI2018_I69.XSR.g13618.t1.cds n=1 Tax=Oikopleura dioica TaxID=34765 RepID=A0ABN7SB44_OIKDI|nr:Oidioi.mRNA.OKI2018_I69.XSR.g13618.t1.cds [Oikopleura dioica]
MVNGRKNFINCDTKQLFFAGGEGSKAEIGLDVQAGSAILISYSAVKTVADAMKAAPVIRAPHMRSHHQQNNFANQNDPSQRFFNSLLALFSAREFERTEIRNNPVYVQHIPNPMVYRPLPPQDNVMIDQGAPVQRPTMMNSLRPRVNLKSILATLPPSTPRLLNQPSTPAPDVETKATTLSYREKEALEEEKLKKAAKFFYVLGGGFVLVIIFFCIKAAFVGSTKPVASTY